MIQKLTDTIDDAIEAFESHWSPKGQTAIQATLASFALEDDLEGTTELIRVDVEKRYHNGFRVELADYLRDFPRLASSPSHVAEVAFEDFRVRTCLGLPFFAERYGAIAGIEHQAWYREALGSVESRLTGAVQESEAASGQAGGAASAVLPGAGRPLPSSTIEVQSLLKAAGFTLVRFLGAGGMSSVYLAKQAGLAERLVVLKLLRQGQIEPQLMAMLQHTHIMPIYSYHWVDSICIICMPYAGELTLEQYIQTHAQPLARDGRSVVNTIKRHRDDTAVVNELPPAGLVESTGGQEPLSNPLESSTTAAPLQHLAGLSREALALELFTKLASALSHAHSRSVLHGDIKPANILVRDDGEPALLDFSLSRDLRCRDELTIGGTYAYMAPEVLRQMAGANDPAGVTADLYSLGLVMFEFLAGRLPYPRPVNGSDQALMNAAVTRRSVPPWLANDGVSPGLHAIVNRCLEFDPADRYQSAAELEEDLRRQAESRPLKYAPEALPARAKKLLTRYPRMTSTVPVASLLGFVLLLFGYWAWNASIASISAQQSLEFAAYQSQADEVIRTAMVDPRRFEPVGVEAVLQPLQQYSLLAADALDPWFDERYATPRTIADRKRVLYRHLIVAAILESHRLRELKLVRPLTESDLEQFSKVIQLAKQSVPTTQLRSLMFIESTFAELRIADGEVEKQRRQAETVQPQGDEEAFLEAVRLMANKEWKAANVILTTLADRGSIPPAIRWTYLGRTQLQLGNYIEAQLSFTQSIEHAPHAPLLWILRGQCSRRFGRLDLAIRDYEQACVLAPSSSTIHLRLADALVADRQVGKAFRLVDQFLQQHPNDVSLLLLQSQIATKLNNETVSEQLKEKAYAATELTVPEYLYRAKHRLAEDPAGALVDIEAALRLQPRRIESLHQLAAVQTRLGRVDDAVQTLKDILVLAPDNEKVMVDLAVLCARQGQFAEARLHVTKSLTGTNRASVLYQAACVYALLPEESAKAEALGYLATAIHRGHGAEFLATDPDLHSLRALPGFRAISRVAQLARQTGHLEPSQPDPPISELDL